MIRKARLDDLAALNALDKKDPGKFDPVLAAILKDPEACLLVAEQDGKLCGYLLAFKHNASHAQWRVCWVEDVLVEESKRKAGLGKELMAGIEAWALAEGITVAALASPRTGGFYEGLGYKNSALLYTKKLKD